MDRIQFEPIGRRHLTPSQKKDRHIKKLRRWVAVLAVADAIYSILTIIMFCGGMR